MPPASPPPHRKTCEGSESSRIFVKSYPQYFDTLTDWRRVESAARAKEQYSGLLSVLLSVAEALRTPMR